MPIPPVPITPTITRCFSAAAAAPAPSVSAAAPSPAPLRKVLRPVVLIVRPPVKLDVFQVKRKHRLSDYPISGRDQAIVWTSTGTPLPIFPSEFRYRQQSDLSLSPGYSITCS